MEVSMVDLRRRTKQVMEAVERAGSVTITDRGKPKFKIVPLQERRRTKRSIREHPAFGMWKDREDMKDVEAYVRNLRQDRLHDLR